MDSSTGDPGRFTQADTIVPNPGRPQDLNRYSYTRNNPVKYTDPTGHSVSCGGDDPGVCPGEYTPPPFPAQATYQEQLQWWARYWAGEISQHGATLHSQTGYNYVQSQLYQLHLASSQWGAADVIEDITLGLMNLYNAWLGPVPVTAGGVVVTRSPFGMRGNPDHQATVKRLVEMAKKEFKGRNVVIKESTSIKGATKGALSRKPDVVVWDEQTKQILKVYEAARVDEAGNFVPREQQKMYEYWELGEFSYWFEVVR